LPLTEHEIERLNLISPAANDIKLGDLLAELQAGGGGSTLVAWADVTGKPATFTPTIGTTATTAKAGNYQPTAANISDATAVGRSVLTAADAAAARTAIGAGTSSLALGTSASQAAAGNHVHTASVITATAIAPGTATNVQGILAELAARISALETAGG